MGFRKDLHRVLRKGLGLFVIVIMCYATIILSPLLIVFSYIFDKNLMSPSVTAVLDWYGEL